MNILYVTSEETRAKLTIRIHFQKVLKIIMGSKV